MSSGPHAKFLALYRELGSRALERSSLERSDYYRNAEECISYFGDYFPGIDDESKICLAAERFVRQADRLPVDDLPSEGHSKDGEKILVAKIKDSDCYQLIQGNHRAAFACDRGDKSIAALLDRTRIESTPIQNLLSQVAWEQGDRTIYQPLPCPELETNWKLARQCNDRFLLMSSFLERHGHLGKGMSYLDIGSYFGWFLKSMQGLGFSAKGVERDYTSILIGSIAFSIPPARIAHMDLLQYLRDRREIFDVVSCLSILHHFFTGRESGRPTEIMRLIDKCTKEILFFEMASPREEWFRDALKTWDDQALEEWVLENTSFTRAHRLGTDNDSRGAFAGNFGRTLFAFTR